MIIYIIYKRNIYIFNLFLASLLTLTFIFNLPFYEEMLLLNLTLNLHTKTEEGTWKLVDKTQAKSFSWTKENKNKNVLWILQSVNSQKVFSPEKILIMSILRINTNVNQLKRHVQNDKAIKSLLYKIFKVYFNNWKPYVLFSWNGNTNDLI